MISHAGDRLASLTVILAAFQRLAPDVGVQRLAPLALRLDQLAIGEGDINLKPSQFRTPPQASVQSRRVSPLL